MSIVEPLPTGTEYGKADWVDYSNYWREGDAEWLMKRSILRYQTAGARNTDWGATPAANRFGQVTYNEFTDRLEMASKLGAWATIPSFINLRATDSAGAVTLGHTLDAGSLRTLSLEPTRVVINGTTLLAGGIASVDTGASAGLTIQTPSMTAAKLTTDATYLKSDKPISASGLALGGGTLTAANITLTAKLTTANIDMSGVLAATQVGGTAISAPNSTISASVVNGTSSGTIGGVAMSGNVASASGGLISQAAFLRGDSGMGYLSYRSAGGVASNQVMTVDNTYIRFRATNGMPWDNAGGGHTGGWVGCVFTSDPGAANAPNGSILLT